MELKNNIFEIDYDKLIQSGYRVFIFDFDNTLNKWKQTIIDEKIIKLFEDLKKKNTKVLIISNGKPRKLNYEIEALWLARKPLTFKIKQFLKSKNLDNEKLVVIGDQLFTDVLLGKLLNAYTIKVEPIDTSHEFFITKFLRFLERILLKILKVMI